MRMDEKIGALSNDLPPTLVKNKAIYGVLSKGLHELNEQTCRKFFPVVRAAIIQMLEQDLQAKNAADSAKVLEREIQRVTAELQGNSPTC